MRLPKMLKKCFPNRQKEQDNTPTETVGEGVDRPSMADDSHGIDEDAISENINEKIAKETDEGGDVGTSDTVAENQFEESTEDDTDSSAESKPGVGSRIKNFFHIGKRKNSEDEEPSDSEQRRFGRRIKDRLKKVVPNRFTKKKQKTSAIYLPVFTENRFRWYASPLIWFVFAVSVWAITETVLAVYEALTRSYVVGGIYVIAVASVCFGAGIIVHREYRAARSLTDCRRCRESNNPKECFTLISALPCNMAPEVLAASSEWYNATVSGNDVDFMKNEYSRLVLEPHVDRGVAKVISSSGVQAAGLVAISPFALADMLIIMAISLSMMNKIALCYGVHLGISTRWRMYKIVLRNMSISGAAELATDVFSQLGAGVTGILSARAGEGILAGRFLTKLGLQIAAECRPVPFGEHNRLSYGAIAKSIVSGVRGKEHNDENQAKSDTASVPEDTQRPR